MDKDTYPRTARNDADCAAMKERTLFIELVHDSDTEGTASAVSYVHIERNMSEKDMALATIGLLNDLLSDRKRSEATPGSSVDLAFHALDLMNQSMRVSCTSKEPLQPEDTP